MGDWSRDINKEYNILEGERVTARRWMEFFRALLVFCCRRRRTVRSRTFAGYLVTPS